jgi:two-component system response regulator MprA
MFLKSATMAPTQKQDPVRERALIVTPDPSRMNVWREALLRRHFAVAVAQADHTALRLASDGTTDVILLDMADPAWDGLASCRRLRADGITLPILMVNAHGTLEDLLAGFDAGADAYLRGWFDSDELLAQIGALCRRHRRNLETLAGASV